MLPPVSLPTRALSLSPLALILAGSTAASAQPSATLMVEMRDKVKLATDIYLPSSGGPFPAVLMRTPYGKAGQQALGDGLRDIGIAMVVQDTRGRFDSEGEDCVFRCDGDGELKDGYDTVQWLATKPEFDGHLVSYGGSALGIVQYMNASATPPALDAMWVQVATPSLYDHGMFQDGVFRKELMEMWLQNQGSASFLQEIASHPAGDPFWAPVQTAGSFGDVQVPAVHLGGWYDIFTQGTIDAFVGYQHHGGEGAKGKQKLIIGPWTHGGMGATQQGELNYPANAAQPTPKIDDLLSLWLGHYLGVVPNQAGIDAMPAVSYYVMGDVTDPSAPGNLWRTSDDWPVPASPSRWYLYPTESLSRACPSEGDLKTGYKYDPADPSPTVGGANLNIPAGPMDQSPVEKRQDIALFSSDILSSPVEVTGRVKTHLFVSIDAPDTDLIVRLTDVYPDQRSMLVADGAVRLSARGGNGTHQPVAVGQIVEAVVDLWSTSIVFNKGHRIRISLTSSNSPRFWPNPNDGTSYGQQAQPRPVQVTVHHSAAYPSFLELPDPMMGPVETCGADAGGDAGATGAGTGGAGFDASVSDDAASSGAAGAAGSSSGTWSDDEDSGCGCTTKPAQSAGWLALLSVVVGVVVRRRRT